MANTSPLVSIIISTLNEEKNIGLCLKSLASQTYKNIQIVVVDSPRTTDKTIQIASAFNARVYTYGTERSAQRNYGVEKASGKYVLILDADMQLSPEVIENCVARMSTHPKNVGVIIPEISIGVGYWSKCKALEKNCYIGDDTIEAARFFTREAFIQVHGYNSKMISGEDWDLSRRVGKLGHITRINNPIYHHEGRLSLLTDLKKKYYYSQQSAAYLKENVTSPTDILKFIFRPAYFRNIYKLLADPIHLPGLVFMKCSELLVGGIGAIIFKKEFWQAISSKRS